jgi:hypothetical protein
MEPAAVAAGFLLRGGRKWENGELHIVTNVTERCCRGKGD